MNPGNRVTMKYDKRFHYGTVIEPQYKESEGLIFVIWDRDPSYFVAYSGEVRLVRKDEEKKFPEEEV